MMQGIFALLGAAGSWLSCLVLDKMPAKCFCDYDETPTALHDAPRVGKVGRVVAALVSAVALAALYGRFGLTLSSGCAMVCAVILVMIALSDLRYTIIPDELIIAGIVLATIGALPQVIAGSFDPVVGAAVGGGSIFLINLAGKLLYHQDALGMGDLKLMVFCGILCGGVGTAMALVLGIVSAAVYFALGMALKKVDSQQFLPLGPFLVAGTLLTLSFRPLVDGLLEWYISLIR